MTVDPYGEERKESLASYEARQRPATRASDADRERTVQQLQQHLTEGRLGYEEFNERVDEAYAARTMDDVARSLRELPHVPLHAQRSASPVPARSGAPARSGQKDRAIALAVNVAVYVVVNVGLLLIWLLDSIEDGSPEFFWPAFPLFFWGMGIIAQVLEMRRNR